VGALVLVLVDTNASWYKCKLVLVLVGTSASCPPFIQITNVFYYLRIENADGYVLIAVYLFIYLFVCVLFAELKKY